MAKPASEKLPPLAPAPRALNLKTYAVALVFSAFLFLVGILVGTQLSSQVSQEFIAQADTLQENTRELELLLLLLSSTKADAPRLCPLMLSQARAFDESTTAFGLSLDALEKSRGRLDGTVQSLKRDYSAMQVRDYLLVKQISDACGSGAKQMIFFYANEGCPACGQQGAVLRDFKRASPSVLVYTLDVDIGTPITNALLQAYGITTYPALVVNGKAFAGEKSANELQALLAG